MKAVGPLGLAAFFFFVIPDSFRGPPGHGELPVDGMDAGTSPA